MKKTYCVTILDFYWGDEEEESEKKEKSKDELWRDCRIGFTC